MLGNYGEIYQKPWVAKNGQKQHKRAQIWSDSTRAKHINKKIAKVQSLATGQGKVAIK